MTVPSHSHHTSSVVTWNATVSNGSCNIYRWLYSDGERTHSVFGTDKLTLEFSFPAYVRVTVSAMNDISYIEANMTTIVQYPITAVTLTVSHTPVNMSTTIMLTVEPEQGYMVSLRYGDGKILTASSKALSPKTGCVSSPLRCSVFSFHHMYPAIAHYNICAVVSNSVNTVTKTARIIVGEPITGVQVTLMTPCLIKLGDFINATVSVQSGKDVQFHWLVSSLYRNYTSSGSLISIATEVPGSYSISVNISSPLYSHIGPFVKQLANRVSVFAPITDIKATFPFGINHTALELRANGTYATDLLNFTAHASVDDAEFAFDFGDGSALLLVKGTAHQFGTSASGQHQFTHECMCFIRITAFNVFYNATVALGPYFVDLIPEGLTLTKNASVIHKNEAILFTASVIKGSNVNYHWEMGDQTTYINAVLSFSDEMLEIWLTALQSGDISIMSAFIFEWNYILS
ncbi:uncharacterized protein LOC122796860 [Protopterus annectens]|uniref:uncharacterized protein LOC122796860 n=1 Tax=Protopterus annectens TaxID=7888 RepID=UPI001CFA2BE7|nr:uncharacterized protein LOC122796860 [Protopterus annectens]